MLVIHLCRFSVISIVQPYVSYFDLNVMILPIKQLYVSQRMNIKDYVILCVRV